MIPKIIHQSWKTTDLSSYGKCAKKSQQYWLDLYPEYEYMFWTDADITEYIKEQPSQYQQAFDTLDQNIKKMDFFRYLVLYEYGGIYSDLDFIMTERIDENIISNHSFIGYKAMRDRITYGDNALPYVNNYVQCDEDGKWVLGQAFFACTKHHNGIKMLIEDIVMNNNPSKSPLHHTGPEKINKIFYDNNMLEHNKTYIYPTQDIGSHEPGRIGYHIKRHRW